MDNLHPSKIYITSIEKLTNLQDFEGSESEIELFASALEARTRIHFILQDKDIIANISEVFVADKVLKTTAKNIIRSHNINLYEWRQSAGIQDENLWWWYLDQSQVAFILWSLLSIAVFILAIPQIIPLLNQISAIIIQIFSNAGLQDYTFDTFALIGAVFQLGIGGSISVALSRRVRRRLNSFLRDYKFPDILLPVTSAPIILVFFFITLFFTGNILLPRLQGFYTAQAQNDINSGAVSSATANINVVIASDSSTYANTLTRIGIEYENLGQFELAKEAYQEALLQDSTLSSARHLLANLLLDENEPRAALTILDEGILQLTEDPSTTSDSEDAQRHIQLRYLLLTSRARAFLQINAPSSAEFDLYTAEQLLINNEDLFFTAEDFENNDTPVEGTINTLEFYYYYALANEALANEALDETEAAGYESDALDDWETIILLTSEQSGDYQARLWNLEALQRLDLP